MFTDYNHIIGNNKSLIIEIECSLSSTTVRSIYKLDCFLKTGDLAFLLYFSVFWISVKNLAIMCHHLTAVSWCKTSKSGAIIFHVHLLFGKHLNVAGRVSYLRLMITLEVFSAYSVPRNEERTRIDEVYVSSIEHLEPISFVV